MWLLVVENSVLRVSKPAKRTSTCSFDDAASLPARSSPPSPFSCSSDPYDDISDAHCGRHGRGISEEKLCGPLALRLELHERNAKTANGFRAPEVDESTFFWGAMDESNLWDPWLREQVGPGVASSVSVKGATIG